MRRKTAILGFAACVAFVVAAEAFFLSVRIEVVDRELYERYGVDLEVREGWRFGFIHGMHGALLVKTPDAGLSGKPIDENSRQLRALMSRELRQIPIKAALESALYVAILGFAFFAAPALRKAVRGPMPDRARGLAGDFLAGALVFGLAAAPHLVLGYGYGGFSNLVGPDAFSYSGPYFHWQSWIHNSSNSISYRAFVSPLMLPASVLVDLFWRALQQIPIYGPLLDDGPESATAYWIAGALVWGATSALLIRALSHGRGRRATPPRIREVPHSI